VILTYENGAYVLSGVGEDQTALMAEMRWSFMRVGVFSTRSPYLAAPFYSFFDPRDVQGQQALYPFAWNYGTSFAKDPIPGLPGVVMRAGSDAPFPFQVAGIQRGSRQPNIIIGDMPGLGKTLQAIGIANANPPRRWLVACPAHLIYNWADEISRRAAFPSSIHILDKARKIIPDYGICILPYSRSISYWRALIAGGTWDMVTLDEFHDLKNHEAQRARPFWGWKDAPGVVAYSRANVALSGTPQLNNAAELFNVVSAYAPWLLQGMTRERFVAVYCSRREFGATVRKKSGAEARVQVTKIEEGKYDAALNAELRASGLLIRRDKSEVLTQLPPKRLYLAFLPPDGKVEELVREETSLYEMLQLGDVTAKELITIKGHVARVRRQLGLLKIPGASQYILDHYRNGESHVMAFGLHTAVLDGVAEHVRKHGVTVHVLDGRVSPKRRHEMMTEFQNSGKRQLALLQIVAAGVGYTLTRACHGIGIESSWVPGRNSQVHDRLHRIGQERAVEITVLAYQHSVEAKVLRSGARKEKSAGRVLDTKIHEMLESLESEG
jgi:SWI/SNF-related matrix-associated actin-dependent regulator 1 of chromatin subfamily A